MSARRRSSTIKATANRRASAALGEVKVVTLDDLDVIDTADMEELRVLVTVHTLKPCFGSLYVKGLGMW